MKDYSKGSVVPFLRVHYNGLLHATMQAYNKGRVGLFIPVHYNV
jgi:hypothetical protein